ncbi:HlyD family efflux transporter periplasmic adaptor subunit [Mesobacterium pallidum]|uniref:HlyD family efflux transporter periplasmic adaptor subunit n=1 Tax=Mesobacterium pallidum TaxID=2872037 RepID=UPI001EE34D4D|nr:HlyD family efflux transporter periplasmic adaptor subunit [Mesobacterium pallidum]
MNSFSANSTSEPAAPLSAHVLFAMGWTAGQARELGEGASVLLLVREPDGVLRPQGRAPSDWDPSEPVRAAVGAVAEHGKPALRQAGPGRVAVAMAINAGGTLAVAAAEIPAETPEAGTRALTRLQWGAAGVEAHLHRQSLRDLPVAPQATRDDGPIRALRLLARALETRGYKDAARTAATELALAFGADRVAIARARRRGAKIEAMSHVADTAGRSRALDLLTAAADEALDQRDAVTWPAGDDAAALSRRQSEALARASGSGSVAALPIGDIQDPWGVILAEFADPDAAARHLAALDIAGDALAPLLEVKRRDDRFWITRAFEGIAHALGQVLGPKALGWKLAALVLIGLVIAGATVTAPARVTADAEITSDGRVVISAPFDGFLDERLVRVGDRVVQGQELARLDEQELQLDRLRQEATRRQKEIERDAAVAQNDRAALSVLTAEIAEIDAQLALVNAQLEAGRMRAPFDGTVTLDQTEGKVGAPVARGAELMVLAPLERRSLTLHVPDAAIDRVAVGQAGTLRLSAMPDRALPFEVTQVTPLTEARDGENTFRVNAELTGEVPPDLGLGMEGVAKVVTGRDLWVLTWAKPYAESLRLKLWSLWP